MNTLSNALPENAGVSAPRSHRTRPYFWSVCRELWENRSLYIAFLIVGGVALFGFGVSTSGLAARRQTVLLLNDSDKIRHAIEQPYDIVAMMLLFTAFVVGVFYSLDALYGERRDRSILFWKSLPVSDLTTILSKVTVPMFILPVVAFVVVIVVHQLMALLTAVVLVTHGMSPGSTWTHIPMFMNSIVLLYGLVAIALWHAPIYGWLLLVSSWARRATFLWAVLPLIVIQIFEKITFGTSYFASFVNHRLFGFAPDAFDFTGRHTPIIDSLAQLTPGKYLGSPGLWIGLVVAVAFLAAAARMRRYEGPI